MERESPNDTFVLRDSSGLNKKDIVGQCVAYAVAHMEFGPEED